MTSDAYPRWRFFPAFQPPPAWVHDLTGIFTSSRLAIDSMVEHAKRMESNDVLRVLADELETEMGFTVERGKKRLGKLPHPVFSATRARICGHTRSTPSSQRTGSRLRSRPGGRQWETRSTVISFRDP